MRATLAGSKFFCCLLFFFFLLIISASANVDSNKSSSPVSMYLAPCRSRQLYGKFFGLLFFFFFFFDLFLLARMSNSQLAGNYKPTKPCHQHLPSPCRNSRSKDQIFCLRSSTSHRIVGQPKFPLFVANFIYRKYAVLFCLRNQLQHSNNYVFLIGSYILCQKMYKKILT